VGLIGGTATGLGLLALFVAGASVASIMTSSVTQRWREIGIRMALDATRRNSGSAGAVERLRDTRIIAGE